MNVHDILKVSVLNDAKRNENVYFLQAALECAYSIQCWPLEIELILSPLICELV